ncbi:EthD domain-containing protein [Novosphingobium sp. 1949]|uniref:EthD domain-containing protein n=1 Tax=Novosphingobium organovorum TaxID=2930092 RepID=A0ABT0BBQ1_9SPHN|nr:EthD domain-containing protein [Novosphingobium organovorum]MCJ2182458.1 EthD domain-containing protein [Novosphingobium organovorum]
MIKMTMFLKRRAGLSHEDFVTHHIEVHGPKFRSIPEAGAHCLCYIQTHPVELETDAAKNADFDGTAELWFDSEQGMEAVLTSETYKKVVFPDEKTFLDHDNTLILVGEQVNIIGDHRGTHPVRPALPGE